MLEQSAGEQDFASPVAPESAGKSRVPWRVIEVSGLGEYKLRVRFVDGTTGTVDLAGMLHSARAGVFTPLRDLALFSQVYVENGAVTWPGDLDLAPDAMYSEIKQHGEWVLL